MKSIYKKISFLSDGLLLKGTLHLPEADHPPVVIGSHGLLSDSSSPKQIELARKCNALGIAFFRFDHRGCGESEGIFQEVTSLKARCNDLINAVKTVRARNDTGNKIGLFGSSMGGAVCISTADSVKAEVLVIFAAPVRIDSIIHTPDTLNGSNDLPPSFYNNLRFDISDKLSNLNHILIFHGDSDDVVPLSNAREIYSKAGEPKKLIIQKGGDHPMSDKAHQENFIREASVWFKRWFEIIKE